MQIIGYDVGTLLIFSKAIVLYVKSMSLMVMIQTNLFVDVGGA